MTVFVPAHDDEGQGPAVVLLHSGVCDRGMWDPQAEWLARTHRVVRPDLRGFGATPIPGGDFCHADDVVALIDHLGIGTATLVGSSFGGQVAIEVAATHPERVAGLVLLCPAYAGLEPGRDVVEFWEEEDRLLGEGDLEAAVELNVDTWLGREATVEWRTRVREMQRHAFEVQLAADEAEPPPRPTSVTVELSSVSARTLVVSGSLDFVHFQRVASHLAGELPRAWHHHLPWAAHLPSIERPHAVTDLLREFLVTHASA